MEWKTKKPVIPKEGQHRERIIFALLPRECEDGVTRWLCPVRIMEQFLITTTCFTDPLNAIHAPKWVEIKCYRAEVEK